LWPPGPTAALGTMARWCRATVRSPAGSLAHGIPTAGNDLVLAAITILIGATIGVASGQTVIMRRGTAGEALARSGWISGFFWVLGMGSRMAFLVWISHGGSTTIATFSAQHSITSSEAWTVALLGMAVAEVLGRTAVLAIRSRRIAAQAMIPATA
jgi:hypothetical protein